MVYRLQFLSFFFIGPVHFGPRQIPYPFLLTSFLLRLEYTYVCIFIYIPNAFLTYSTTMKLTELLGLRRILNSSYHPFRVIPKPSIWPARERLKRLTAWQYGQELLTVKAGYRKLHKVFIYADIQRRDAPNLERYYSEERLKAAVEEHSADYYVFRRMLSRAHIELDHRALFQLALYEPRTFKCLVDLAQKMAMVDGELIEQMPAELAHVQCDGSLFGTPLPKSETYPIGAVENHIEVPRQLKEDEY